ncbi:MAG: hypothetical protein WBX01_11480 [Nitrososphaeraceae archaeon]
MLDAGLEGERYGEVAPAGKGKNRIDNIGNRVKDRGEFGVQTRTRIS